MSASCTFDETVSGLADRRMSGLGLKLRAASVLAHCLSAPRWLESSVAFLVDRMGRRVKSQAIWFQGASAELLRLDNGHLSEKVVTAVKANQVSIVKVKQDILEMRKALLDLQGTATGARLKASAARAASHATDLFEALESYRWTLLELEANQAQIREGYLATNAAELGSILDRIAAEG